MSCLFFFKYPESQKHCNSEDKEKENVMIQRLIIQKNSRKKKQREYKSTN